MSSDSKLVNSNLKYILRKLECVCGLMSKFFLSPRLPGEECNLSRYAYITTHLKKPEKQAFYPYDSYRFLKVIVQNLFQ